MRLRSMIGYVALATAVTAGPVAAQTTVRPKQISRLRGPVAKGRGRLAYSTRPNRLRADSKRPLTPEYQKIFEANLAEVAKGGFGDDPVYTCIPEGMPRAMNLVLPMEIVITPGTTYVLMEYLSMLRRIYTDGRDFPTDEDPSWMGYSIGKWIDEDGSGRYNVLEVETRNLKNPRTFDPSGLLLHKDRRDHHQGAVLPRQGQSEHAL